MNPSREEMFSPGVVTPVSTFSIVVGDLVRSRCQAHCPGCVARCTDITPHIRRDAIDKHLMDWEKNESSFHAACRFAKVSGVTTIMFTGKGEPTLYQNEISTYLELLRPYQFPFVEIQTNGIAMNNGYMHSDVIGSEEGYIHMGTLQGWRKLGMTHVALSIAHWDKDRNNEIYRAKHAIDHEDLICNLALDGFSVRVCCLLMKDYIDSVKDFKSVVQLCLSRGARQLKVTPINKPDKSYGGDGSAKWVADHMPEHVDEIVNEICSNGHYLRTLPHGAPVFDYDGLSVCVSDCLPRTNRVGNGMQPIFWPDGSLGYSWEHRGAVLM